MNSGKRKCHVRISSTVENVKLGKLLISGTCCNSVNNTEVYIVQLIEYMVNYAKIGDILLGFPVNFFCTKIVQKLRKDLLTFRVKISRNFDVFAH